MKIYGKHVAVEQLVLKESNTPKARGIDYSAAFTKDLVKSKVLFDCNEFQAGTIVYFRADIVASSQNKAILTLNETKFVMFPVDWVTAFDDSEVKIVDHGIYS